MDAAPAWVGIDASCDSLSVCTMGADGSIIDQVDNLPSDPVALTDYLRELGLPTCIIGIESGSGTHLTRAMRKAGFEVRVLGSGLIRATR